MFNKTLLTATALCAFSGLASAAIDVPITGNIESKCVITTDTPGVFGNPTPDKLSTLPADGGVLPIIQLRYYRSRLLQSIHRMETTSSQHLLY